MELNTEYGKLKYNSETKIVWWAQLSVWDNWPKLAKQGILRTTSEDGYLLELAVVSQYLILGGLET